MNTYQIHTAIGTVEQVEADRAVREDNRVSFLAGDEEVASFVGASGFSIVSQTPKTGE